MDTYRSLKQASMRVCQRYMTNMVYDIRQGVIKCTGNPRWATLMDPPEAVLGELAGRPLCGMLKLFPTS